MYIKQYFVTLLIYAYSNKGKLKTCFLGKLTKEPRRQLPIWLLLNWINILLDMKNVTFRNLLHDELIKTHTQRKTSNSAPNKRSSNFQSQNSIIKIKRLIKSYGHPQTHILLKAREVKSNFSVEVPPKDNVGDVWRHEYTTCCQSTIFACQSKV